MAKYDPDRIAALAAGALAPAEAAALEAAIAADPRAAADLAAQRLAIEAVRSAPAPLLSDVERTDLRRAVAAALHLDDSAEPAAAAALASRRRVPWRPLAVAAAALTALVAAVPLFGLLSVGDEASETTIALSATTMARDLATAGAESLDFAAENGAGTMLDTSTTAAATTTLPPATLQTREMSAAHKTVQELVADPARLLAIAGADGATPCLDEARLLLRDADPVGLHLTPAEGGPDLVVWFLSSDGATVADVVAFDPATCELLAVYP